MEVAPTWSMVSVVRVLRDTMGMIVVMVSIIVSMKHCIYRQIMFFFMKMRVVYVGKSI